MKQLHRRVVAVLAVLVLTLAACGGSKGGSAQGPSSSGTLPPCPLDALAQATTPVDVVVWHQETARGLDTLTQLVGEYNASQSKVRVHLESQGSSYTELQRKFNEAIPSKQLPGLIVVDDTFTRSMADSGVVLPAQSCFNADGNDLSGLVPTARSYYTINGVLWPANAGLGNVLLYYNKDHFRRAGLDPNKTPQTLAEVREYAEKLKAAGVSDKPLVHEFAPWKTEFWLTGAHSSMVNNDNGRGDGQTTAATFDGNQQALDLFTWFKGMQADGLLNPIPETTARLGIDQYLAIASGTSSMLIDTSSAATSMEAFLGGTLDTSSLGAGDVNAAGLDLGAGTFPGLTGPGTTQMGGSAWYIMNTTPAAVQAGAWDFMRFMNTVHAQAQELLGGSYLPWVKAAMTDPSVVSYFAGDSGIAGAWLKIANDEVNAIDPSFPGPLIGPYDQFRDALRNAQDNLMFSGASPADALKQAQTDVDKALQLYNTNA